MKTTRRTIDDEECGDRTRRSSIEDCTENEDRIEALSPPRRMKRRSLRLHRLHAEGLKEGIGMPIRPIR